MSENNETPPVEADASPANTPETTPAELFEVHGKQFDLSSAEGKGQLKGFLEAMSSELGRKNNEVGTLRKFAAAVKPSESEEKIISQARSKAAEGDLDAAIDSIFGYSKAKIRELEQRQAIERENSETWDTYLSARQDLLKIFDKKTIKKVSETELDIYAAEDPFKVLDSFWLPKTKISAASAEQAPAKKETPPATPSGGSARTSGPAVKSSKPETTEKVDLLSIFDTASRPRTRS